MKSYDLIVSLGSSCGITMALRSLGLQRQSMPFDWLGSPGLPEVVAMIESDFAGWLEKDDLVLWDVTHEKGVIHRFYKNLKTGFGFPHEFSNAEPFEENYGRVREKYARRVERFRRETGAAKSVLFAYLERPYAPRLPDETLVEMRDRLARRHPAASVDLLYVCVGPDRTAGTVSQVSESVTVVEADYRVFRGNVLMHMTDNGLLARCLAARCSLTHPMTDGERRECRRREREKWLAPYGKNPLARRINRTLHDWYCRLEDYLITQHILPGGRPVWFEGEGK